MTRMSIHTPTRAVRPSPVPRTRAWGIGLAFITSVISGIAIFTNGRAIGHFDGSAAYTTAKNLVAAVALTALVTWCGSRRSEEGWTAPRTTRQLLGLVVVGVVGGSVPFLLFFEGMSRAGSSGAAFIHKTLVVWVALLAVAVLRERVGRPHIAAIAAIVVGQAALAEGLTDLRPGSGEVLVLMATLLWSVEIVVAKRLLADLSALTVGVSRMALGGVVLVAWLVATGQLGELLGYGVAQWGWVLLTGALLTGYVATWYAALARAQAVDVTAVLVFGAMITAILDGVFRDLPLRPDLVGLGLIALGVAIVAARPQRCPALEP